MNNQFKEYYIIYDKNSMKDLFIVEDENIAKHYCKNHTNIYDYKIERMELDKNGELENE